MNNFLRTISRILFAGLIFFEFLNQFKILHFQLDFTWFGLVITCFSVWLSLEIISLICKHFCQKPLSGLVMLIAAGGIYIDAFGDILHFYSRFGWYDKLAHLIGGTATAVVILAIVWSFCQCKKIKVGFFGQSFIVVAGASLLGALYEIEEYLEDYFTGSHRLGDGPDTANDMLMNLIGACAIIVIVMGYRWVRGLINPKS